MWNYLSGYVKIEVTGFSVERFINMVVHKGVRLWNVCDENGHVTMNVPVKAFKSLKPCARKTKCRTKILKKRGLPFLFHRYRKRKLLVFGALFFVLAIYFLSSFIWLVQIDAIGSGERVNQVDISAFLEENNVKFGSFKHMIKNREIEKKLLEAFPDISWVNLKINGTRAVITLTETKPKAEMVEYDMPCDIIAKKDGLITYIVTSAGTPLTKKGDVVREGDVLVSGELIVGTEETGMTSRFVHASAEIKAKMYYEMTVDVPFVYGEREYTGEKKKEYALSLFENIIKLNNANFNYINCEKISKDNRLSFGKNYPLPFAFTTTEYREFKTVKCQRTVERAEAVGYELITNKILSELNESDIIERNTVYEQIEDAVRVTSYITTVERIDLQIDMTER